MLCYMIYSFFNQHLAYLYGNTFLSCNIHPMLYDKYFFNQYLPPFIQQKSFVIQHL